MLLRGKYLQHRLLLHPCEHTAHSYDETIMVEPYGTQLSSNSDLERESRIKRTACSNPLLEYFYRFLYPLFAIIPSHFTSATTHNSYHYRVVIRRKQSGLVESSELLPPSYSNFLDPVTPKPVFSCNKHLKPNILMERVLRRLLGSNLSPEAGDTVLFVFISSSGENAIIVWGKVAAV